MTTPGSWVHETTSGSAAELHELSNDFSQRVMRVNHVSRPAVVLSSTQSSDVLDMPAVERLGLDVARRSSGGGLVYLGLDEQLWVDFFLPRGDTLWVDDVSHSGDWLGDLWVRVLDAMGIGGAEVASGAWSDPEIGRIVCFAATGPCEVMVGGRKLVGVSQRRTRAGARFQCTLYRTFDPAVVMSLISRSAVAKGPYQRLADQLGAGVVALDELRLAHHGPDPADILSTLAWELVEHLP